MSRVATFRSGLVKIQAIGADRKCKILNKFSRTGFNSFHRAALLGSIWPPSVDHSTNCERKQYEPGIKMSLGSGNEDSAAPASSPFADKLVVVVLGSTASGKSKLAIDLAKHVDGEIISADSMQVYEGLDILTNKVTEEEMQGIPHYMLNVADRLQKFDVVQFRDIALPIVEDILSRNKVPVVVGGTNYYIESLLYKVLMNDQYDPEQVNQSEDEGSSVPKRARHEDNAMDSPISVLTFMKERGGNFSEPEVSGKWSAAELYEALREIDPPRALRMHPNDTRKVIRSLQVFFRTGKRHSELIEEQCCFSSEEETENNPSESGKVSASIAPKLGGPLRFPNSLCFWIQVEREVLIERINHRVEQMAERGMKDELDGYVDQARQENRKWDFEEGQLQSIGVKEFQSYIQLSSEERDTDTGKTSLREGLELLKIATRQYAKKQVQWIRQRFLKASRRQLPYVYGLDGNKTDSESWNENVTSPAIQILDAHLNDRFDLPILKEKLLAATDDNGSNSEDFILRKCEVCNKTLTGSLQYEIHMKSAKHWKVVKRRKQINERKSIATSVPIHGESETGEFSDVCHTKLGQICND